MEKLNSQEIATQNVVERNMVAEETAQQMAERLQKEVDAYKEQVSNAKTQEELDEMEKVILQELQEYDDYIKTVNYTLPTDTVFEGKTYSRSDVAGKIVYFIGKIEQTWQYVLGLYELCRLWKSVEQKEISFGALDSTLRLLDQCKFKGMTEWRDILIVNEYMKSLHEQYAKDTTLHIAIAQRHNEIIKQRDLITPVEAQE